MHVTLYGQGFFSRGYGKKAPLPLHFGFVASFYFFGLKNNSVPGITCKPSRFFRGYTVHQVQMMTTTNIVNSLLRKCKARSLDNICENRKSAESGPIDMRQSAQCIASFA